MSVRAALMTVLLACSVRAGNAQTNAPPAPSQNPSPMIEVSRAHERIAPRDLAGVRHSFAGPLGKPVSVFVPASAMRAKQLRLLVHFHGAPFPAEYAVSEAEHDYAVAAVQLGSGSGVYDVNFSDPAAFTTLLDSVRTALRSATGRDVGVRSVTLSGFSAGHGAIRAILRDSAHYAQVDAVLLLDGMHTSYEPPNTVVALGGKLDRSKIAEFVRFADEAARGQKRFLITHSEIFPGTFASTTETANYLLEAIGLRRSPVLKWGPLGMQQTSEARKGRLMVLGFAGNSAPDHVDHFHGMYSFLRTLHGL
jgi:hypothetical protein